MAGRPKGAKNKPKQAPVTRREVAKILPRLAQIADGAQEVEVDASYLHDSRSIVQGRAADNISILDLASDSLILDEFRGKNSVYMYHSSDPEEVQATREAYRQIQEMGGTPPEVEGQPGWVDWELVWNTVGRQWHKCWSDAQLEAWKLPENLTVSQCAEKYRVLDPENAAESGPWSNARTPYLVEIMDNRSDPGVEKTTVKKCTQVGLTETILNCILYDVLQDPSPAMMVCAREEDAKNIATGRIARMLANSPAASKQFLKSKSTNKLLRFKRMVLDMAYPSPAVLASKPKRCMYRDEVNKYPDFSSKEADPLKLSDERTKTFYNRYIMDISTPTVANGYISREYEQGDKRQYYVPCPECNHYQTLQWQNVIYDSTVDKEIMLQERRAFYACESCGSELRDNVKPWMLSHGLWCPADATVVVTGIGQAHIEGGMRSRHRSYHINALYSPWVSYAAMAFEWLSSKDEPALLMNFTNSWLGEDWLSTIHKISYKHVESHLKLDYKEGRVPEGVVALTAGVDVQKGHGYFSIRGWARDQESWLVARGIVDMPDFETYGWDDLEKHLFNTLYLDTLGRRMLPVKVFIDTGYRTDEVYRWCRTRLELCCPVKGQEEIPGGTTIRLSKLDRDPQKDGRTLKVGHGGIILYNIDVNYYKTMLYRLIQPAIDSDDATRPRFHVFDSIDSDYLQQLVSEEKSLERVGTRFKEVWHTRYKGQKNHYLDCEVYNLACSDYIRVRDIDKALVVETNRRNDPSPLPPSSVAYQQQTYSRVGTNQTRLNDGEWVISP